MTTKKNELEERLFEYLANNQGIRGKTMSEIKKVFHNKNKNLVDILREQNIENNPKGLISITKVGNTTYYYYKSSAFMEYYKILKPTLAQMVYFFNTEYFIKLKELRPIFKNVKLEPISFNTSNREIFTLETYTFDKPNDEVKVILEKINSFLNHISQMSFVIPSFKSLNKLPLKELKLAELAQSECLEIYKKCFKLLHQSVGRNNLQRNAINSWFYEHNLAIHALDLNLKINP